MTTRRKILATKSSHSEDLLLVHAAKKFSEIECVDPKTAMEVKETLYLYGITAHLKKGAPNTVTTRTKISRILEILLATRTKI